MARYAPVVDTAAALALAEDPQGRDRPGVLEYEVINPVGAWLAEQAAARARYTGQAGDDGTPATLTAAAATPPAPCTQAFLGTPPHRGGAPPRPRCAATLPAAYRADTRHPRSPTVTDPDTPTLGWQPIPPPTVADDGPPRPSAVETPLAALLDALATEAGEA